jgi:GST-like protein
MDRCVYEARRHWNVLDTHLEGRAFMVGDAYSVVDMAAWGWARMVPFVLGEDAFGGLPNVKRLLDTVNARPAAQRAEALKGRHAFKAEMDDEARRVMFRHIKPAA